MEDLARPLATRVGFAFAAPSVTPPRLVHFSHLNLGLTAFPQNVEKGTRFQVNKHLKAGPYTKNKHED